MEHCRTLKFEDTPNYKFLIGLFESLMEKNNFNAKILDYTWKQNRLQKEKLALINSLKEVINKKPGVKEEKSSTVAANMLTS